MSITEDRRVSATSKETTASFVLFHSFVCQLANSLILTDRQRASRDIQQFVNVF